MVIPMTRLNSAWRTRGAMMISVASLAGWADSQSISTDRVAGHLLDFSGALVSIREDYTHTRWPVARRTFILRGANGHIVRLALADGGAGELSSLNLYARNPGHRGQRDGHYLVIGVRDCIDLDPVAVKAAFCAVRPTCQPGASGPSGLTFVGRFDWMNGFDPPRGEFHLDWRFLPFEDATEGSVCKSTGPTPG
jgi:hypothetical protein